MLLAERSRRTRFLPNVKNHGTTRILRLQFVNSANFRSECSSLQFEARAMADSIQQAIKLIEAGKFDQAHAVLLEKLQTDPKNDVAWYWMSKVVAS